MKWASWISGILIVLMVGGFYGYRQFHRSASADQPAASYHGEAGKTALDLLRAKETIETVVDPNLGEFVTSIDGVKSGTNGQYWIYEVNGQPESLSPNQYQTKPTDTITWKLQ